MDDRTVELYRREFPVTAEHVYLDHAGVAPLSLRARMAIEAFLRETTEGGAFHYPSWARETGRVREQCARLVGAAANEIAFVKNTSHGLSLVARGLDWKPGDNAIYCQQDFPSNVYPWTTLVPGAVETRPVPLRFGRTEIEDIESRMDSRTRVVAVSSVQFASGHRIDLRRLGVLCKERGALLCVDAIQSLGVLPMDVEEAGVDYLSADAHKWLLGPEGIGIFFCRKDRIGKLAPSLIGWKSVKNELDFDHPSHTLKDDALRFEEGSMNMMGIVGLGAAVDLLLEAGIGNIEDRVLLLGDAIIEHADRRGYELLTPRERNGRGGGVSFRGGFDPAVLRDRLRQKGIMVNARGGGLRVSPHFYNTTEEIARLFLEIDRLLA